MASWSDFLSLFVTVSLFAGTIAGVLYIARHISQAVSSTQESLKSKGLHISQSGMSVKTSRHFDREDYVDATQRGFIKAIGASTFGQSSGQGSPVPLPIPVSRSASASLSGTGRRKLSAASTKSNSSVEERRMGIFSGLRRTHSGTSAK